MVLICRYAGHKVAVDAYGWLHKAAYCCSYELCEGIHTDRQVLSLRIRRDVRMQLNRFLTY